MVCVKMPKLIHIISRLTLIGLVGCLCLAFIPLPGEGRGSDGIASVGQGSRWLKLAENWPIQLWAQPNSGLLKIVDGRSRLTWESDAISGPLPAGCQSIADYWKTTYQSAFIVRYFSNSGTIETVYTGQDNCQKRFAPCRSGGRFTFEFPDCRIRFQVVYTLGFDNNLQIVIPFRQIADREGRLLDIRVLPYFGPLTIHSRDYLVMPDGCGGIVKPDHYPQEYHPSRIYGERFTWNAQPDNLEAARILHPSDYGNPENSFLSMPIFGVVKEKGAFLGVISRGRFQADLGVEISTVTLRPTVSIRWIFRETTCDMLGRLRISPVFDRQDRRMDYYFLEPHEASYVGIALKYRKILLASLRRPRTVPVQPDFRLRLFMGVTEKYLDTTRLIRLTRFNQSESILEDLYQRGVRRLQVTLVGWSSRGYLGDNPRHFPPDRSLGGITGLKRLLATGKRLGFPVGLQFNNSYTFKNSHGFKRGDTVKDIQGIPVDLSLGQKEYLFCPEVAWKHFLKNDFKTVRRLGVNGLLLFESMNRGLFICYDRRHPVNHQTMAQLIDQSFRSVSRTNPVAVTASSDCLSAHVTALYDVPERASDQCDESIPLIPIIYHGWLHYSFESINIRSDGRREFLKTVEYGAVPNAYLTAESVTELVYAKANPVCSGKYADWRRDIVNEYRVYQHSLRDLQNRIIVNHQRLAPNVYLTVYDNGVRTIVNYGSSAFAYGGTIISALNYAILR